jgi:hypothetical protein
MHASKSRIQLVHYLIALPNPRVPRRGCMKRTPCRDAFIPTIAFHADPCISVHLVEEFQAKRALLSVSYKEDAHAMNTTHVVEASWLVLRVAPHPRGGRTPS